MSQVMDSCKKCSSHRRKYCKRKGIIKNTYSCGLVQDNNLSKLMEVVD